MLPLWVFLFHVCFAKVPQENVSWHLVHLSLPWNSYHLDPQDSGSRRFPFNQDEGEGEGNLDPFNWTKRLHLVFL